MKHSGFIDPRRCFAHPLQIAPGVAVRGVDGDNL
jgi:hypothetical protein